MSKLGQGPAFPFEIPDTSGSHGFCNGETYYGMSKRLYIATAIAKGLCGNSNYGVNASKAPEFAKICYALADELLRQENE